MEGKKKASTENGEVGCIQRLQSMLFRCGDVLVRAPYNGFDSN